MVHFVGAGPGAPDLITLRGAELLKEADVVIYAGSLVNPALLELCKADCALYNSAEMTLEQVLAVMTGNERDGKRWTLWTGWVSPTTLPPASPPSAGRRRRWRRSIPCPASARA